jgi:serine O-acetyltransferase
MHSFWETVYADAAAAGHPINTQTSALKRLLQVRRVLRMRPGFASVFWLRVNQLAARKGWRGSFRLRIWRHYKFANDISEYAHIGPGLFLPHPIDVTIGSAVRIGNNAIIYNGVTLGSKRVGDHSNAMPTLGDGVIVYTGAKLIGGITVGNNVEIGALALCVKDVPSNSVMYGIPPNVTVKSKVPQKTS